METDRITDAIVRALNYVPGQIATIDTIAWFLVVWSQKSVQLHSCTAGTAT